MVPKFCFWSDEFLSYKICKGAKYVLLLIISNATISFAKEFLPLIFGWFSTKNSYAL